MVQRTGFPILDRRGLLAGFGASLVALFGSAGVAQEKRGELTPLVIQSAGGKRHVFQVEVANTDEARAKGLMFRREMPADHGMIFDYGRAEREVAMWMKNTLIPLDMLFIRRSGSILNIAERTVPHSLASVYADGPVQAVLELNGGTCARLQIKPGDQVLHKIFGNLS